MMLLLWRAPMSAALCKAPSLVPLFLVLLRMGWQGIPLDISTVMIASVVLGITVDDTIHRHHSVKRRLAAGASPVFAIARSYEAVGRAVLATAAILIGQFLVLAASGFEPTANFGLMSATALTADLVFELLLLPALLVLWYGRGRVRQAACGGRLRLRSGGPRRDGAAVGAVASTRARASSAAPSSALPGSAPPQHASGLLAPASPVAAGHHRVLVCQGEACRRGGAAHLWRLLRPAQRELIDEGRGRDIQRTKAGYLGPCPSALTLTLLGLSCRSSLNLERLGVLCIQAEGGGRATGLVSLNSYGSDPDFYRKQN